MNIVYTISIRRQEVRTMTQLGYEKITVIKAIINNKNLKGKGGLPVAIAIYNQMTNEERNNEVQNFIKYGGRI